MIKYLVCVLLIIILIFIDKIKNNFGDIIGTFNGVNSYSNKENKTNLFDVNYYNGICTGVKWVDQQGWQPCSQSEARSVLNMQEDIYKLQKE